MNIFREPKKKKEVQSQKLLEESIVQKHHDIGLGLLGCFRYEKKRIRSKAQVEKLNDS